IPFFKEAQEIVDTAVRTKVLAAIDHSVIPRRDLERDLLAGNNTRPDIGCCASAVERSIERGGEGIDVVPIRRKNGNGVAHHARGQVNKAAIHQFYGPTEEGIGILASFIGIVQEGSLPWEVAC